MKAICTLGFLLSTLLHLCVGDIYLHLPHGSNNRLNGNGANVRNANRLFDSQVRWNLDTKRKSIIWQLCEGVK